MYIKKIAILFNILSFNFCRLIPFRNKKLWVFGALEGKKYDDNSKYMFEYMLREHGKDFRCIWLTNDNEVIKMLHHRGVETYLNHSWKGIWVQMRSGVAFYTHGLMDFGLFPLVGGAEIVALWHGMGFKQIYNGKYHGRKLKLKRFLDYLFSWTYRTVTPVTSQYMIDWAQRMFTLNPNSIYITGQPRNDAFKTGDREKVLNSIGVDSRKKVIVYMPTYRHQALGVDYMDEIVKGLYQSEQLKKAFEDLNASLLVKLHPLTPQIDLPQREDFKILGYKDVEDNQQLMGACDMLITDYSSCYVDYALLHRPIIFYLPDEKVFFEKSEKLDDGFMRIANTNKAVTVEQLIIKIKDCSLAAVAAINNVFEDDSTKGTLYSENVYKVVTSRLSCQN